MTNEEKSAIISKRALGFIDGKTQELFEACMEMAKWKDEQITTLIDNAKDFLAEYFWEHPHCESVIQSAEFTSIDDLLEKFENRMKGDDKCSIK